MGQLTALLGELIEYFIAVGFYVCSCEDFLGFNGIIFVSPSFFYIFKWKLTLFVKNMQIFFLF